MADHIVSFPSSDSMLECLTDQEGRPVLLHKSTAAFFRRQGRRFVELVIDLTPDLPIDGLTVTEAARLLVGDLGDGMTLEQAKSDISAACNRGQISSVGHGRQRRIDATSFDAYRLKRRDRANDADEKTEARLARRSG